MDDKNGIELEIKYGSLSRSMCMDHIDICFLRENWRVLQGLFV